MTIKIREATEDDSQPWDSFLHQFPHVPPYGCFAWKNILEDSYRVQTHFFMAEDDEGNLCGILPAYVTKTIKGNIDLYGLRYGFLYNQPTVKHALLSHLSVFCRERIIRSITIPIGVESSPEVDMTVKKTVVLPLAETEEATWKSLRDKTRNMIRKGERLNLRMEQGFANLDAFYSIYTTRMKQIGVWFHAQNFFVQIAEHLKNQVDLLCVKKDGQVIAGMVILYGRNIASYPYQATLSEYRDHAPTQFLNWAAVKQCLARNILFLDMGESTEGSPVYQSKVNFGGIPKDIYYYDHPLATEEGTREKSVIPVKSNLCNGDGDLIFRKWLRPAKVLENVLRYSPLWLCQHISPRLIKTRRII